MTLSIEENISESFRFAKDGLVGHWGRWIILIILNCIPIVNFIASGYIVKIYKGGKIAPELEGYGRLFINGVLLFIIGVIYIIIPFILICAGLFLGALEASATGLIIALIGIIVVIILGLFALLGCVRFAKTGDVAEAFNFKAILEKINEIGWGHYILSYIAIMVVITLISGALSGIVQMYASTSYLISGVATLLLLIVTPFLMIWQGKFYENLYSLA